MLMLEFINNTHAGAFDKLIDRMGNTDVYHAALAYLITLDGVCRKHINSIYDFSQGCIKPECLQESWQTSTTLKTCRLAFNLYTNGVLWCEFEDKHHCTPSEIFCCDLAPYYWQAIRLRYPEYTSVFESE